MSSRRSKGPMVGPRRAVGRDVSVEPRVRPWETVDLATPMSRLLGTPLLVGDQRRQVVLLEARGSGDADVRAWSARGNRKLKVPGFSTVSAVAATLGVVADVAIAVTPTVRWRPGRAPALVDADGASIPLAEALGRLPLPESASDRVARVRSEYGRLAGDIVYRIENAALFDPAVPITARFETAMALWAGAGSRVGADAQSLAAMVEVTFDAARANAETVGLAHLPEQARADARRAAGAARLAAHSTSESERLAAERQAIRILGSLSLYYLPTSYPPAVTSGVAP